MDLAIPGARSTCAMIELPLCAVTLCHPSLKSICGRQLPWHRRLNRRSSQPALCSTGSSAATPHAMRESQRTALPKPGVARLSSPSPHSACDDGQACWGGEGCANCSESALGGWEICYPAGLKTIKRKPRIPLPAFETGQVWQMVNSNVHIGLIGKTLVHYKHYRGDIPRAPISLAGKSVLEKYLSENDAVLVQRQAQSASKQPGHRG